MRLGAGIVAGVAIAAVDNFAFEGEASPIIIVALLLASTAAAGSMWGHPGWVASIAAWACVPLPHIIKHVLNLPDTLHPNTYVSILLLSVFTLVIAAIGTECGALARRIVPRGKGDSGSSD